MLLSRLYGQRQEKYDHTNNKEQKSKQYREAWEAAIEEYNNFGQATFGAKVKVEKGQAQLFYGFKAGFFLVRWMVLQNELNPGLFGIVCCRERERLLFCRADGGHRRRVEATVRAFAQAPLR